MPEWDCRDGGHQALADPQSPGGLLLSLPGSLRRQRIHDQSLQHLLVHIRQLLDVETALAGGVLAEFRQQRVSAAESDRTIQDIRGFTRRETDERHIALAPTV